MHAGQRLLEDVGPRDGRRPRRRVRVEAKYVPGGMPAMAAASAVEIAHV
jgi:hypothetical protein